MIKRQVYPEPIAGAFIMNRGRLLLISSYKWKSIYSVPGGHIELGEGVYDATKREVKEEVGMDVSPKRVIGLQEAIYPSGYNLKRHFLFINVLCNAKSDRVGPYNDEVQGHLWVRPKDALGLKLSKYTRRTIKDIIRNTKNVFYPED
jgi:nucleoside triphosphatase